jgi:hypothetical protein
MKRRTPLPRQLSVLFAVAWCAVQTYGTDLDTTELKVVEIKELGSCDFCKDSVWHDTVKVYWKHPPLHHSDKWDLLMKDYRVRVIERIKP